MPPHKSRYRYKSVNQRAAASLGLMNRVKEIKKASIYSNRSFDEVEAERKILEMAQAIPHQYNFLTAWETRYIALCGGVGSGKTWAVCAKTLLLAFKSQGLDLLFFEPSLPLLSDIAMPQFDALLEALNVPYTMRKTPRPEYRLHLRGGDTRILLRSMENWTRILGINSAACVIDEVDTVSPSVAEKAVVNIQARCRVGATKQKLVFGSTPEGYKFLYDFFHVNDDETKLLIQGKTKDNPYLADGFVEDLEAKYPPALVKAYLEGEFVNLETALVFSEYNPDINCTNIAEADYNDVIVFGCDFNIHSSMACFGVIRPGVEGQILHIFMEKRLNDTHAIAEFVRNRFGRYLNEGRVICYPDASGQRGSTSATETDHDILRNVGIKVISGRKNPPVSTIIAHANNCFHRKQIMINRARCRELDQVCSTWGYDESLKPIKKRGGRDDPSNLGDALKYLVYGALPRVGASLRQGARWR